MFPWMFDEFAELRKVREAAHLVAADAGEDGGGCSLGGRGGCGIWLEGWVEGQLGV